MLLGVVACLWVLLGVVIVFRHWHHARRRKALILLLGWSMIASGVIPFCYAAGAEFGIIYWLCSLAIAPWLITIFNLVRKGALQVDKRPCQPLPLNIKSWGKHLVVFLLVVPLAGVSAILTSVLLTSYYPASRVNTMVSAVYIMPLVWGAAAYWLSAASRTRLAGACISFFAIVSATLLFM
ncbi:MAG: hypothetical protein ACJA13_001520 [Paraglaciecola sp.]|jgi:hypothetical protein